jgi:hypothetical protein
MKKFILIVLVSAFACLQSKAQITITRSDFGNIGDVVYYGNDTTTATLTPGSGGANKVWDFSTTAVADFWDSATFVDPAVVPGAPSEANLGLKTGGGTDFFYIDNTQVRLVVKLDDYGVDNQSVKISSFPFTYLSTLKDSAHTQAQGTPEDFGFSGLPYDSIRIDIKIVTTSLVDGWGTLKIGSETYDALRVRNETNVDVTVEGKLIIVWTPIPVNLDRVQKLYAWYGAGKKYSLAEAVIDTAGDVEFFRYQSPVFHPQVGLSKVLNTAVKSSYPNPANDNLTVELKSEYKETVRMEVSDITGKIFVVKNIDASGNTTNVDINTQDFPDGMYIAHFSSMHTNGTAKFVVKH